MQQFWNFLETASIYFEIVFFLMTTLGGFLVGYVWKKRDGKKLRKIIGFSQKGTCEVILPVWKGNIEYSQKEVNFAKKNYGKSLDQLSYYQKDEAEMLILIQQMNNIAGFNKNFLLKDPNATDLKVGNDKLICGGPLSNIYLKHIFSGEDTSPFTF